MCDSSNNDFISLASNGLGSSSTGVFPSITEFAGPFHFEIILSSNGPGKKKWLYSEKLKKVFIDINKTINIQFSWYDMKSEYPCPRFIRALPVYTQDDWLRIPVERCPMHKCYEDNLNIDFPWVNHVLRCDNEGTQYEVDQESRRRSCVTPVILTGNEDIANLQYKFVCKTSCYRGMQRRPVVVIFTLEDILGNVLGRRCLSFKVCSCLKRDLYREENVLRRKRNRKLAVPGALHVSKQSVAHFRAPSSTDLMLLDNFYSLRIQRLKKEYLILALKTMHDSLLGQFMRQNVEGTDVLIHQVERYLNNFLINSQNRFAC